MDERLRDYLAGLGANDSALDGWTIRTAQRAGVDVAFVATLGPEIHFVSIVGQRAMSRRNIAEHLGAVVREHGYATTRVPLSETDHRLREALGFVPTWQDVHYQYFALTALPYQKKHEGAAPCQLL